MKRYILFTAEELDDMIHGEEIERVTETGDTLYFMCAEHVCDDEPVENAIVRDITVDSVIFENQEYATDTLIRLQQIIDWYGFASLADLYDLVGLNSKYEDNKIGWRTLEGSEIVEDDSGYELRLPTAISLE